VRTRVARNPTDRERAEEIFHGLLAREREGDAADAQAGQERGNVHVEVVRDPDHPEGDHEDLDPPAQHRHEQVVGLGCRARGHAGGDCRDPVDDPAGRPDGAEHNDEPGAEHQGDVGPLGQREELQAQQPERSHGDDSEGPRDPATALDLHAAPAREPYSDEKGDEAAHRGGEDPDEDECQKAEPLPVLEQEPARAQPLGHLVAQPGARVPVFADAEPGVAVLDLCEELFHLLARFFREAPAAVRHLRSHDRAELGRVREGCLLRGSGEEVGGDDGLEAVEVVEEVLRSLLADILAIRAG
jgi:hypothetical protein